MKLIFYPNAWYYCADQSSQGLFEGLEVFLFPLFLRNNSIIKCLKHCVRFELTTQDTRYKAFEGRGTTTYERDEKKKEKNNSSPKPPSKLSFTLMPVCQTVRLLSATGGTPCCMEASVGKLAVLGFWSKPVLHNKGVCF
jgi:hypothetical protein